MKYNTLLFDADMTLLDFDRDEEAALNSVLAMHGVSADGVHKIYHEINLGLWKRFELGEIKKTDITSRRFAMLLEKLGIEGDGNRWNDEYVLELCNGGRLIKGADELCRKLKERGTDVSIITNGTEKVQLCRLERSGLMPYVDNVFISERIGWQKPLKEFFDYVLKELDVTDKNDVLVIGDSLSSDIKGGINSGLDTCLFNPAQSVNSSGIQPDYEISSLSQLFEIIE